MKISKNYKSLLSDIYKIKSRLILAILLSSFSILLSIISPWIIKNIVDKGIVLKQLNQLIYYILIALILSVVGSLLNYATSLIYQQVKKDYIINTKIKLMEKFSLLSGEFLTSTSIGKLMNVVDRDIGRTAELITDNIFAILRDSITAIFAFFIMINMDFVLFMLVVVIQVILVVINKMIGEKMNKKIKEYHRNLDFEKSSLEEYLINIVYIVKSNAANFFIRKYRNKEVNVQNDMMDMTKLSSINFSISNFLDSLSIFIIWGYGGYKVLRGVMTLGELQAFMMYSGRFISPLLRLTELSLELKSTKESINRVYDILNMEVTIKKEYLDQDYSLIDKGILFRNINFSYRENECILNELTMFIPESKMTSIVGKSGSGKSTLINLLTRIWDIEDGEILINGINIKAYNPENLRDCISLVSQEPEIFNDTIYNNIVLDREASYEKVIEITKLVGIYEYINSLPDKLDTMINKNGINLSGGQKQKIALCRAIIKDAPIIALDEVTSDLDNLSEEFIKNNLSQMFPNKTIIIISHRLNIVENSDLIYVLDKGKVIESGSHEELLDLNGEYKKLYYKEIGTNEIIELQKAMI